MSKTLLEQLIANLYGDTQSLTEVSPAEIFGHGDLSWVYAHPPSKSTLLRLLTQPQCHVPRGDLH